MPKVTVIIPVYNVEKYLRECLDSVINQTLQDIEIICINDCTPDNSPAILEEYAQKDSRIKIIKNEKNLGLGETRNVALPLAKSPYVFFVDSDDWIELNGLEILYNAIIETDSNIVMCDYSKIFKNKLEYISIENRVKKKWNIKNIFGKEDIKTIPFHVIPNLTWNKMYKKDFLLKNKIFFAPYKWEDQIFSIKAKLLSNKNMYINKSLYNYRMQDESITKTSLLPFLNIYTDVKYILENLNLSKEYKKPFHLYLDYLLTRSFETRTSRETKKSFINEIYSSKNTEIIFILNKYLFKKLVKNLFSIGNMNGHKYLRLLGIKIKLK